MIHAYLDPASGSALISAVVAGAAGAGVAAKTIMGKMRLRSRGADQAGPRDDLDVDRDADAGDPDLTVVESDIDATETVDEPSQ